MNSVRAKFNCHYVEDLDEGSKQIHMSAVTGGSEENEKFSEYTPSGTFSMIVDKGDARFFFEEGKDYYLDITKVE